MYGAKKAVDIIEETVLRNDKETAEMPEMVDMSLIERQRKLNGYTCCFCYLLVTVLIAFGIWGISDAIVQLSLIHI